MRICVQDFQGEIGKGNNSRSCQFACFYLQKYLFIKSFLQNMLFKFTHINQLAAPGVFSFPNLSLKVLNANPHAFQVEIETAIQVQEFEQVQTRICFTITDNPISTMKYIHGGMKDVQNRLTRLQKKVGLEDSPVLTLQSAEIEEVDLGYINPSGSKGESRNLQQENANNNGGQWQNGNQNVEHQNANDRNL